MYFLRIDKPPFRPRADNIRIPTPICKNHVCLGAWSLSPLPSPSMTTGLTSPLATTHAFLLTTPFKTSELHAGTMLGKNAYILVMKRLSAARLSRIKYQEASVLLYDTNGTFFVLCVRSFLCTASKPLRLGKTTHREVGGVGWTDGRS